jgi:bifunctional DNase/RNase
MYYVKGEQEIELHPGVSDAIIITMYHKAPIYITKEILEQMAELEPRVTWHG